MKTLKIVFLTCLLSTVAPTMASGLPLKNMRNLEIYEQTQKRMLLAGKTTRQELQKIETECLDTHVLDFLGSYADQLAQIENNPGRILTNKHLRYTPCRAVLKELNARSESEKFLLAQQERAKAQKLEAEEQENNKKEQRKDGLLAFVKSLFSRQPQKTLYSKTL